VGDDDRPPHPCPRDAVGAGLVIIAAGLRAAAPIVNAVLISGLLALTVMLLFT
jgi:hypothetical protein